MPLPNEKKESQSSEIPYNPVNTKEFMEDARNVNKVMYPKDSFIEERVELFKKEYRKAYQNILSDEALQEGNSWFEDFLRQSLELYRERIIEGIEKDDFKEIHHCGFNDGISNCDCYLSGRDRAIDIIRSL